MKHFVTACLPIAVADILLGVYLCYLGQVGYALFCGVIGSYVLAIWKTHR